MAAAAQVVAAEDAPPPPSFHINADDEVIIHEDAADVPWAEFRPAAVQKANKYIAILKRMKNNVAFRKRVLSGKEGMSDEEQMQLSMDLDGWITELLEDGGAEDLRPFLRTVWQVQYRIWVISQFNRAQHRKEEEGTGLVLVGIQEDAALAYAQTFHSDELNVFASIVISAFSAQFYNRAFHSEVSHVPVLLRRMTFVQLTRLGGTMHRRVLYNHQFGKSDFSPDSDADDDFFEMIRATLQPRLDVQHAWVANAALAFTRPQIHPVTGHVTRIALPLSLMRGIETYVGGERRSTDPGEPKLVPRLTHAAQAEDARRARQYAEQTRRETIEQATAAAGRTEKRPHL